MVQLRSPQVELENAHAQSVERVFAIVGSSEKGLTPKEVEQRLIRYGPNILVEEKRFKTLRLLAAQFKNFFVILLLLASVLSFIFESSTNGIVLLAVVALNVAVSFFQERKAEKTLEALRQIHPARAEVIRAGEVVDVPVEGLTIGDVVVLREGGAVPADLRLFEVRDLKIDEAVLTGESIPSDKTTEKFAEATPLADRENMAYSGTHVVTGTGKGVVTQSGSETEFGRIATFVQEQEEQSLLLERITHLGVWLTGFAVFLSGLIFVLGFLRAHEFIHMLNLAIAVFVSAVPESLPTVTTLALATTALRLSREKVLVRHLSTVEALSGINLFAFDKTGTLTRNEMTVAKIALPDRILEVTGAGFSSEGMVFEYGKPLDVPHDEPLKKFVEVGALAGAASISSLDGTGEKRWAVRGDPTEGAFLILAEKTRLSVGKQDALKEFAFTSERRMRTKIFFKDQQLRVYSMGAAEVILPLCRQYFAEGREVELSLARRVQLENQAGKLASGGYRVIALATKERKTRSIASREVEKELTFVGFAGLLDKPKERVDETFATLIEAGIKPVIITGDHPETALAVARELGLKVASKDVLSGSGMDNLSDEELLKIIPQTTIYARITPTQKYRLVKAFKRLGLRVAVSGDGVNDAPALKKADVGVVMGEKGADVSKEAADLVILDDKIETVLPAIIEARTLYDNIRKFFIFLLSGNFEELLIIAAALLAGLPQPLTTLQILWINFVTDGFPALALAYEPPTTDVLREPPRDLSSRMVRPIFAYALFLGFISLIGEALIFLAYLPDVVKARTMLFTAAVLFELFIVFSIRSKAPLWRGLFSNRYLVIAFLGSFLLQLLALYAAPLRAIMGVTSLGFIDWGVILAFIAMALVVAEGAKWLWRKRG